MNSPPASLSCSDCGRSWTHQSAPRWRASLSDDGTGTVVFTCERCVELRKPAFALQLEFVDGGWTVAEARLSVAPQEGDVIRLYDDQSWEVYGTREVPVAPAGKPPRRFFVCRPALAA
jgi:hypothetical protein